MAEVESIAEKRHDRGQQSQATIPSLGELLHSDPDQFVARYTDIAAVNLACARGLPNADESEFSEYLTLLDTIADAVRRETDRSWRLFKLKPAQFHHSENVFRIFTMEHVFRVRFNIRYDPIVHNIVERESEWRTSDSTEIFIHGILSEKRTGTCSSLPTFAIAVGRRLGYPLKLVLVPNHTLYRWEDGDEVFNLQHTEAGGEVQPDEYFHEWPYKWREAEFRMNQLTGVWLRSMNPKQEVSKFLCNRANFLRDIGRYDEALEAIDAAERFNPINPACLSIRVDILDKMQDQRDSEPITTASMKFYAGAGMKDVIDTLAAFLSRQHGRSAAHAPFDENTRN
jgi:tetratricopeptide (TPR) repeat protein